MPTEDRARSSPVPLEWAADRADGTGEEGERTLYPVEGDECRQMVQVWNDIEWDADSPPVVGFFATDGSAEYRRDFTPDQALDLAAMLIVHAENARATAVERALDEAADS